MTFNEIISILEQQSDKAIIKGKERVAITSEKIYGIKVSVLRQIAKKCGKNKELGLKLWEYGYLETRMLASMIYPPEDCDSELMDSWVKCFDNWEITDQCVMNLFEKIALNDSIKKAYGYCEQEAEFIKRTGFVIFARLAGSSKKAANQTFLDFFPVILKHCKDERNFVKKAVNWAIRGIGKRNNELRLKCIELCEEILKTDNKTSIWIAKDSLKELTDEKIISRIKNK